MPPPPHPLHSAQALVIEGNLQSRSILVSQLRELGVGTVVQCSRLSEARRKLESTSFDVVICEQHFERETNSGQDLLDDLRRNQLLPFHTVFVMITAEASYTRVAEAAESALDAYLLKPHTAARLADRIVQARLRKHTLQGIFSAIEAHEFELAATLCVERFETRDSYWLYAARIGAELMLRLGRMAEAQRLYEAVIDAKTLPWARLGVARVQLESGQPIKAVTTLESLIRDDDGYADAYDLMGRAQFELGNFQNALGTYQTATRLTPSSVSRLLKHGMLAYYTGERSEGVEMLERATRLGLDSKLFDAQALMLLAFARFDEDDKRGLLRTIDHLIRLRDRSFAPERTQHLLSLAEGLLALMKQDTASALEQSRQMLLQIGAPGFTFESACNLLGFLQRQAASGQPAHGVDAAIDTIALRFCTSRAMTELLACAASGVDPWSKRIRAAHAEVAKITQDAMTHSLKGEPQVTVELLLQAAERTSNARFMESAHQVLLRYGERIESAGPLHARVNALRLQYGELSGMTRLGEHGPHGPRTHAGMPWAANHATPRDPQAPAPDAEPSPVADAQG